MKYLITDTDEHTLGEINQYFKTELAKTNLNKEDIVIDEGLKVKIGIQELDRIFDENGMLEFIELNISGMNLKHTGNFIEFSDEEIDSRFDDAYQCILSGLIEIK